MTKDSFEEIKPKQPSFSRFSLSTRSSHQMLMDSMQQYGHGLEQEIFANARRSFIASHPEEDEEALASNESLIKDEPIEDRVPLHSLSRSSSRTNVTTRSSWSARRQHAIEFLAQKQSALLVQSERRQEELDERYQRHIRTLQERTESSAASALASQARFEQRLMHDSNRQKKTAERERKDKEKRDQRVQEALLLKQQEFMERNKRFEEKVKQCYEQANEVRVQKMRQIECEILEKNKKTSEIWENHRNQQHKHSKQLAIRYSHRLKNALSKKHELIDKKTNQTLSKLSRSSSNASIDPLDRLSLLLRQHRSIKIVNSIQSPSLHSNTSHIDDINDFEGERIDQYFKLQYKSYNSSV